MRAAWLRPNYDSFEGRCDESTSTDDGALVATSSSDSIEMLRRQWKTAKAERFRSAHVVEIPGSSTHGILS